MKLTKKNYGGDGLKKNRCCGLAYGKKNILKVSTLRR